MAKYKPSDILTANGETKSLNEFAEALNCPVQTIISRLKRGEHPDTAVAKAISQTGGQNRGKRLDADILVGDEVERLLNAGSQGETGIRDRAILVIAYRSGLRCSEILSLMPKDIDIQRGTITVHHGKGDKARTVALDPSGWIHVITWSDLRATWTIQATSPLFCTRQGGPINARQVRAMIQRRAKTAGIAKHVHAHGLRRTMASEMASEGVPLMDISGALGHSSPSTTDTYLKKVNPTSVLDAMRARTWGAQHSSPHPSPAPTSRPTVPPPDWIERLRNDIGSRLRCLTDARKDDTDFEVMVLLF
jgi:site-specific recombinase XerD